MPCAVREYHVYKSIWDPNLEESFTTRHERVNPHDRYAMAVIPDNCRSPSKGDFKNMLPFCFTWWIYNWQGDRKEEENNSTMWWYGDPM